MRFQEFLYALPPLGRNQLFAQIQSLTASLSLYEWAIHRFHFLIDDRLPFLCCATGDCWTLVEEFELCALVPVF